MKNWIRSSCSICFITTNYSKPSCLIEIQGRYALLIHIYFCCTLFQCKVYKSRAITFTSAIVINK